MKTPRVELICIGTELLTSKINTHTTTIGDKLAEAGLLIAREHTLPDDPVFMAETFAEAWRRSDVVISCGGLGPTFDDLTRDIWARAIKKKLVFQKRLLDEIREKFNRRGLKMPPENRRQAYVFEGADVIPNVNGTAPGQFLNTGNKLLFLLPGPAREMIPMLNEFVLPQLKTHLPERHLVHKAFHFAGIPESTLDDDVRPLVKKYSSMGDCRITHGILASQAVVTVKFFVEGETWDSAQAAAEKFEKKFLPVLRNRFFGRDQETLPKVLGRWFQHHHKTLAVAESCTGGLISKLITDEPGSSTYFIEGLATYSNRSKMQRLNVRARTLQRYGAVSAEVARDMARNLRLLTNVDYAISVTGVAGPGGGTLEKPVGLIFIGCATPRGGVVEHFHFSGERTAIRQRAAVMALELLRRNLPK